MTQSLLTHLDGAGQMVDMASSCNQETQRTLGGGGCCLLMLCVGVCSKITIKSIINVKTSNTIVYYLIKCCIRYNDCMPCFYRTGGAVV
jgi:hypothetical protein